MARLNNHTGPKKQYAESETHDLGGAIDSFPAPAEDELFDGQNTTAPAELQRWNYPKGNALRIASAFWCFIVLGMNDAAYGALIPYLETYYSISYTVVSLVFLSPLVGYFTASLTNNIIHTRFGQRGIAMISPSCKIVAYVTVSVHPPYPVLVVVYLIAGFGAGLEDAAWNAWIGAMENPNELLGFLHGFYGVGATISPLIATSMVTKGDLPWWNFYYVLVSFFFPASWDMKHKNTHNMAYRSAAPSSSYSLRLTASGTARVPSTSSKTHAQAERPAMSAAGKGKSSPHCFRRRPHA